MPRTVVCIPTYCEVDNVAEVLRRTRDAVPDADVLVADDSSPDGTADVVKQVAADLGQIDVLVNPGKVGLGGAYRRAFAVVLERGYEIVCQMDADLSHDPAVLPELIGIVESGDAIGIGSRYVPGGAIPHWPWHRRALSRYGNRYACGMLDLPVHDVTSGFRSFSADALRAIDYGSTRATGYGFQIECAYRAARLGLSMREMPIVFTDRVRGASKLSTRVAVEELALVSWWGVRDRALRR
ncbi:MAG TPA: polyprenol monophosphomannose synthase [Acidimicrobiales bacterium]